jgi:hypothetical protein
MRVSGKCMCGSVRWHSSEPPIVTRVCLVFTNFDFDDDLSERQLAR